MIRSKNLSKLPQKRQKRLKPSKGIKRPREKSISKLIKEADKLTSRKVRKLDEEGDTLPCYTCGGIFPKKSLHCSHYLSRYYKAARWKPDNLRACCFICNIWKKGDLVRFRQNLIKEIGIERVEAVEALRDAPLTLTRGFLTSLIEELKK